MIDQAEREGLLKPGGTIIELAGGVALAPGQDEAGLIGGWQRGIHRGLVSLDRVRVFLCAIATPVKSRRLAEEGESWPTAAEIGGRLLEIVASDRGGGLCCIVAPDCELGWPGAENS